MERVSKHQLAHSSLQMHGLILARYVHLNNASHFCPWKISREFHELLFQQHVYDQQASSLKYGTSWKIYRVCRAWSLIQILHG